MFQKRIESLKARDIVTDTPVDQENNDSNQQPAKISSSKKLKEAKLTRRKPTIITKKIKESTDADKEAVVKKDSSSSVATPSTTKSLADSRSKKDTKTTSSSKKSLAPSSKETTSASPPVSPRGAAEEEVTTAGPKRYPVLFVFDESFPVRTQRAMINPALPTVEVHYAFATISIVLTGNSMNIVGVNSVMQSSQRKEPRQIRVGHVQEPHFGLQITDRGVWIRREVSRLATASTSD